MVIPCILSVKGMVVFILTVVRNSRCVLHSNIAAAQGCFSDSIQTLCQAQDEEAEHCDSEHYWLHDNYAVQAFNGSLGMLESADLQPASS